jgi:hypothetical protein
MSTIVVGLLVGLLVGFGIAATQYPIGGNGRDSHGNSAKSNDIAVADGDGGWVWAQPQEIVTTTTPIQAPAASTFRIARMRLDFETSQIEVVVKEWDSANGAFMSTRTDPDTKVVTGHEAKVINAAYNGTQAATMLKFLNTANLTTNTFQMRVLSQLINDGFVPSGTISGTAK